MKLGGHMLIPMYTVANSNGKPTSVELDFVPPNAVRNSMICFLWKHPEASLMERQHLF